MIKILAMTFCVIGTICLIKLSGNILRNMKIISKWIDYDKKNPPLEFGKIDSLIIHKSYFNLFIWSLISLINYFISLILFLINFTN